MPRYLLHFHCAFIVFSCQIINDNWSGTRNAFSDILNKIMANFTATLDLHQETHHTKNVADNHFTTAITAAAAGLVCCSKHPGIWISRPKTKMLFMKKTEVRDCPACVKEISSSSDLSSANKTALQSSVQATPVNSQLKTTKPSVESNFRKPYFPCVPLQCIQWYHLH